MVNLLDIALVGIALGVFGWGFERYRRRFVKADLLIAAAIALGLLLLAFLPVVFDWLGTLVNIQQRFILASLLANTVLLTLVLYLIAKIRNTRDELSGLTRRLSVEQAQMTNGGHDAISVVIPAYNEADTIQDVLAELPETLHGKTVHPIIVSDGSTDATVKNAMEEASTVVEHHTNRGQGGALKTGFEIARKNDADIVVTMDADGQHPVDEFERLVSPIIDDEADFTMGSRYKGRNYSNNSVIREAGIRTFTWLINLLTKSSITDCTNGYRAIRGSKLEDLTLTEERFNAPELIIEARKNGLRIKEIPITVMEREVGVSKKPQLGYALGLARTILTAWIR